MKNPVEDFEFLAWMRRAGFMNREAFVRDMVSRGADETEMRALTHSEAFKRADLVAFYQDWGMGEPELWAKFIGNAHRIWTGICRKVIA